MATCLLNLSTGACTPMYMRLAGNGTLAPQHVAVSKIYAKFAILLCALVCEVIILPDIHNKHPCISSK
jgi:hypothetical protein